MADSSIDATKIDVDTDENTKTVTLKGSVATAAQKASAERIAKAKAEGYTVRNSLTVAR
jgi:osmotically-inducible protein OsmY